MEGVVHFGVSLSFPHDGSDTTIKNECHHPEAKMPRPRGAVAMVQQHSLMLVGCCLPKVQKIQVRTEKAGTVGYDGEVEKSWCV